MFVVHRGDHNPIIVPTKENLWESVATFNCCPVVDEKEIHCLYRAVGTSESVGEGGRDISTIGYCHSKDGIHFTDRRQFLRPELPWEKFGCEDPRVTKFEDGYFIFYTALGSFPFRPDTIRVGLAISKNLEAIEEKHLITPFNAKAMALFPERIGGKIYAVLTANTDLPPSKIALASFDKIPDLWSTKYWEMWHQEIDQHTLDIRRFPSDQVEVGAPPIKTDSGWLIIYSHIQNYLGGKAVFGVEALLLDLKNPKTVIGRTAGPILVPEEIYERFGQVPNVIFPSGALVRGKKLEIYYGAGDTTCAKAEVNLEKFIESIKPNASRAVIRFEGNPILKPDPSHSFEAQAVFNPAAVEINKIIYLLYRAQGKDGTSTIGLALSRDGFHINERLPNPVYEPREPFEKKAAAGNSGVEDPRITKIGERLYMTYTAFDGLHPPAVAATSITVKDFLNRNWRWEKSSIITPSEVDDKDSCFFPEKIGGKYMILHRIGLNICADFFDTLDLSTEKVSKCVKILKPRPGMWDGKKVGIAAPPIKTKEGWLLFYHGISDRNNYRIGAALLDLKDPTITISRTTDVLLGPEESYEKNGQVPNVVFPCGIVKRGDTLFIYYGGADQVVAVATMKLSRLLEAMTS